MPPKSPHSEQQKQTSIPDATANKEESPAQDRHDEEASKAIGGTSGIPVVGIGGSAGALESFKRFFAAMPVDSGAAFVVI
jgi:chemotaxis response regulator CheB